MIHTLRKSPHTPLACPGTGHTRGRVPWCPARRAVRHYGAHRAHQAHGHTRTAGEEIRRQLGTPGTVSDRLGLRLRCLTGELAASLVALVATSGAAAPLATGIGQIKASNGYSSRRSGAPGPAIQRPPTPTRARRVTRRTDTGRGRGASARHDVHAERMGRWPGSRRSRCLGVRHQVLRTVRSGRDPLGVALLASARSGRAPLELARRAPRAPASERRSLAPPAAARARVEGRRRGYPLGEKSRPRGWGVSSLGEEKSCWTLRKIRPRTAGLGPGGLVQCALIP